MRGVVWEPTGPRVVTPLRIASGITGCRHAISRPATVSALIWSSGRYLVPAWSAAYAGHSTV